MTAPPLPVLVEAPAKINLYLHVVGRRPDGYHLLDGLVTFVAIGDTLVVEPLNGERGLSLTIDGPFGGDLTADDNNLVVRAARRLAAVGKVPADARLLLTKRLPVASGIGGGSADAAAALKALAQLWRLDIDAPTLAAIALELGADVPMCLAGRPAFIGGIGEVIDPAPRLPPCWLVLANPGVPVATPEVFKARTGPFSPIARFDAPPADVQALAMVLGERWNDLMIPALGLEPRIAAVLLALEALEGALLVRMSGSGATCFAMFGTEAEARAGAARLQAIYPAWWVIATPVAAAAAKD